jgi:hypothetical protein
LPDHRALEVALVDHLEQRRLALPDAAAVSLAGLGYA